MLAHDTTAVYSLLTDGKRCKLRMEQSSLESIHHLPRVSTKSAYISVKTIILKSARKSLDGRSHSSVVASSMRLKPSILDVYG